MLYKIIKNVEYKRLNYNKYNKINKIDFIYYFDNSNNNNNSTIIFYQLFTKFTQSVDKEE